MEIESRFVIGKIDLESGRTYGWLSILANKTGKDFTIYINENGTRQVNVGLHPCFRAHCYPQIEDGPELGSMYVTALYFTMTCMTSIGFGNVAADTDTEKTFTLCMMIGMIGCIFHNYFITHLLG